MNYSFGTKKIYKIGSSSKMIILPKKWLNQIKNPNLFDMEIDENQKLVITPHTGN